MDSFSNKLLDYQPANSQKRKANTSLSLYDSDEEINLSSGKKSSIKVAENNKEINTPEIKLETTKHSGSTSARSVCIERKGEREEMQDRHLIIESFESSLGNLLFKSDSQGVANQRCSFYALFDGHAGSRAAEHCAERFAQIFISICKKFIPLNSTVNMFEKSMKKIFIETYKTIDEEFLAIAKKHKPALKDGTTATTIFLLDNSLYCANIGDSKAVVCRHKPEEKKLIPLQLTVDHNPIVFDERMRIQKAGGIVKDGRVMGILEVSRSIGDGQMKAHGVISTPDIKKLSITPNDHFLILACDGLWKTFTPEAVVEFVMNQYKTLYKKAEYKGDEGALGIWTKIADEMSAEAVRKGCGDNVSVLVIILADEETFNAILPL